MHQSQRWLAFCVVPLLFSPQAAAANQMQRAEVAEEKAEVLEQDIADEDDSELSYLPTAVTLTKPEVQAIDPAGAAPLDDAITCLARTIYWEARGEEPIEMESVANVVMNRLGHVGFPDTVCGVVKQGSEQGNCQFSWWCDGRSDAAKEEAAYALAKEIARKALNRQLTDRTGGALYFHHRGIAPDWAAEYIMTLEDGEFVFYKPYDGKAR